MFPHFVRYCLILLCSGLLAQTQVRMEIDLTYDDRGRVESITHPGGKVQRYSYNPQGDHVTVRYDNQLIVSDTGYWHGGLPASIEVAAYGSMPKVTLTRAYDVLSRVTELKLSASGTTRYRAHDLTYNAWGFIASLNRTDPGIDATWTYAYGSSGELTSFAVSGTGTNHYTYDNNGNLTARSGLGGSGLELPAMASVSYDQSSNRRQGWSYDADGNLLEDDHYRYRYNALGRVSDVFEKDKPFPKFSFLYNGFGHRVREINDTGIIWSARLPDGQLITQEIHEPRLDGSFSITRKDYIYLNGYPLLTVTHYPDGTATRQYRFPDRMGHAAVVVDEENSFTWEYREYSPYGHQMMNEDPGVVTHEYTGHERDDTGWDYMLARYYHWQPGRFNRPDPGFDFDPLNPMSYNLYQYGRNNPVNGWDPTGEIWNYVIGGLIGGAADLGAQLIRNGGDFSKVDYFDVAVSTGLGALSPAAALEQAIAKSSGKEIAKIVAKEIASETVENIAGLPMPTPKKVRNPWGKKGGPLHQQKVKDISADIKERELNFKTEFHVRTPDGKKSRRFADVAALDDGDNLVELHQVGKQTKKGIPVKRERDARDDLQDATGVDVQFTPYNDNK